MPSLLSSCDRGGCDEPSTVPLEMASELSECLLPKSFSRHDSGRAFALIKIRNHSAISFSCSTLLLEVYPDSAISSPCPLKCFAWLPQTSEDVDESGLPLRDCRVRIWISQISLEFDWWIYSATYGKVYLPFLHHRLTSKSRRSCWRDPGRESASHCRVEGTCHCRLFR